MYSHDLVEARETREEGNFILLLKVVNIVIVLYIYDCQEVHS